ncbi:MAG: fumarylacetoacetate hydrolase family protein [Alphaproteobacteria bacterium]|nr:fumarylacetoacetate hydrolase family protein [Alphaproteobacteria bacterium]MDE2041518.1 fumarylacetoacetate hydrolase family protein [Alphaproteobacteria bacterium]MDE2340039.1 fumarylacetoacetate hydrolase family protein [Alphaproteobacteria bacterium]
MKLVSYNDEGRPGWGMVDGTHVCDLSHRWPDLKAALCESVSSIADAAKSGVLIDLDRIIYAPVIPNPGKIMCVGHNYESHRIETGREKTEHPSIFTRFADSQVGHMQPIIRPNASTMLDYEGELAVVIGQGGRNIAAADALAHVAGYACYNDASVRDWQWHTKQFTPGKNFPGTGAFGPWLVTSDEIPDPQALSVTTTLNGTVMQSQPTSEMIFPVAEIIAYVSAFTPLSAGDVIVTGTPGGVGAKRQPPVWMQPGDVVEIAIPGIGTLQNTVTAEA